ncbi:MAG: DUF1461 domain-containing protein [Eggerthellaceae bacterium]|nr:DUF1461 domain-containing protein [Eggerthellaceae bacterium]
MGRSAQAKVLVVLATIALAITYIGIGFAICAGFPMATQNLSKSNSDFEGSPYTERDLTSLALEVRAYTVEDYLRTDDGETEAQDALATKVMEAASSSAQSQERSDAWADADSITSSWSDGAINSTDAMYELYQLSPSYALDSSAVSHLNDVNTVISSVRMPLIGCTLIAAFCLMCLVMMFGAAPCGRALLAGGIATIVVFVILGAWAAVSFDSLFAVLHSIFFANGTWTFPADSLLIQMYPQGFWIGMGIVWLASSCVMAAASIVIGAIICKRERARKAAKEAILQDANQA